MALTKRVLMFLAVLNVISLSALASEAELQRQAEVNEAQAAQIEELRSKVDNLEMRLGGTEAAVPPEAPPSGFSLPIDRQGDLSGAFVGPGDFPNSIKLPGVGRASLAIGGYVKTIAIWDSHYEYNGVPSFVPAILGLVTPDKEGQMHVDASLSQVNLRTQAPVGNGVVGSWLEFNFQNGFNLMQAFMHWAGPWGEITAGKQESAVTDKDAAIVAVTDPNVHGAGYKRATVFRYGRNMGKYWKGSISLEDPDSNDILPLTPTQPLTEVPNVGARLRWGEESIGHVQLAGLYRRLKVKTGNVVDSANGWGFHLSTHFIPFGKDQLIPGISYGEGLGTHLLGEDPFSAGVVMPDGQLELRRNYGYYVGYRRYWTSDILTDFAYGYAEAGKVAGLPGGAFRNADIYILNTIFRLNQRVTFAIEYQYGSRENMDHTGLDSNRVMVSLQLY